MRSRTLQNHLPKVLVEAQPLLEDRIHTGKTLVDVGNNLLLADEQLDDLTEMEKTYDSVFHDFSKCFTDGESRTRWLSDTLTVT